MIHFRKNVTTWLNVANARVPKAAVASTRRASVGQLVDDYILTLDNATFLDTDIVTTRPTSYRGMHVNIIG